MNDFRPLLTAIANAIRKKTKKTDPIKATYLPNEIEGITDGKYNVEFVDLGENFVELKITTVNSNVEDIHQDGSALLIINTGAVITQNDATVTIGG